MATGRAGLRSAIHRGRAMAAATLVRRRAAVSGRRRALASLAAAQVTTAGVASAGTVVAEGDSWFDYPFHDVLKALEDEYAFDVESVAHRGDTVEDMAYSSGQLDAFARRVEKILRTGVPPRAILLSGGGNDIAGDEFAILLDHAASGAAGLNDSIVKGVIDERLQAAYVTIVGAITALCQQMIGKAVPVVVHGYDYPVPDGRGVLGGFGPLPGPWLEPGFRRKGYADMASRRPVVKALIDRFNTMLQRVAKQPGFGHVRYLDLRGTLQTGATYKQWWGNELHPTAKGFSAVAAKFAALI